MEQLKEHVCSFETGKKLRFSGFKNPTLFSFLLSQDSGVKCILSEITLGSKDNIVFPAPLADEIFSCVPKHISVKTKHNEMRVFKLSIDETEEGYHLSYLDPLDSEPEDNGILWNPQTDEEYVVTSPNLAEALSLLFCVLRADGIIDEKGFVVDGLSLLNI